MKCIVCGKEFNERMFVDDVCSDKCFDKYFWADTLNENAIIIDGMCYHVDNKFNRSKKKFTILFNDGIRMTTNNLWCDGKIPEEFLVPDNAKFL